MENHLVPGSETAQGLVRFVSGVSPTHIQGVVCSQAKYMVRRVSWWI